jgi:hypothetical protein
LGQHRTRCMYQQFGPIGQPIHNSRSLPCLGLLGNPWLYERAHETQKIVTYSSACRGKSAVSAGSAGLRSQATVNKLQEIDEVANKIGVCHVPNFNVRTDNESLDMCENRAIAHLVSSDCDGPTRWAHQHGMVLTVYQHPGSWTDRMWWSRIEW